MIKKFESFWNNKSKLDDWEDDEDEEIDSVIIGYRNKNSDFIKDVKNLKKGDRIIIHKPGITGEGINTPVIFIKYSWLNNWIVVSDNNYIFRVGLSQDPSYDDMYIEKF